MNFLTNVINQIVGLLKYHFGGFWIVAGLIMLLVAWSTTKKALKVIAVILIIVGVAMYAPGLMTGTFNWF